MSRTKRKRKAKQKLKIIRKRKAGKLVRFVLTNSGRKYSGWSNRYNYQSNIHSIILIMQIYLILTSLTVT